MEGLDIQVVNRLVELGRLTVGAIKVEGSNVPLIMQGDGTVKAIPEVVYNDYEKTPNRVVANVELSEPASFEEYYRIFSSISSRVFANEQNVSVNAILDYHDAAGTGDTSMEAAPGWCQHKATLQLKHSPEWQIWAKANNQKFTQVEFAEFLEQNSMDICDPTPATMMEVAKDLQATTEVEFASAQRSNDGQVRFKYTETTKSSVGSSQLAVPDQFRLALPVFVGGSDEYINALLRFRTTGGHLTIWFTMVRPEHTIRDGFIRVRDKIAENLGITIISGSVKG